MMLKTDVVRRGLRRLSRTLPCVAVLLAASPLWAEPCAPAGPGCASAAPCGPTYVEKTIYVPNWITKTKMVVETQYRPEQREKTVTVYRCVPETRVVERRYTVLVPQVRTKTHTYTVRVPEWSEVEKQVTVAVPVQSQVEQSYTVMVPYQETRTASRTVCQMVPEQVTHTVCRDRGQWEEQLIEVPCPPRRYGGCASGCGSACGVGGCGAAACAPSSYTCTRRVWVPNIVHEQVQQTVYRPQYSQQPYEYVVTLCRPETRTRMVTVTKLVHETQTRMVRQVNYRTEERTREVRFTVCVPEERVASHNVTTYRRVAEEKVVPYTVMVPFQTEREVAYRVCEMVPKTITVPVNAYGGGCNTGCHRRCCR